MKCNIHFGKIRKTLKLFSCYRKNTTMIQRALIQNKKINFILKY